MNIHQEVRERWRVKTLEDALRARWAQPCAVDAVALADSTNTRLMEVARTEAPPTPLRALVAEAQTAGRGRHGRAWQSTAGASLAFSVSCALPQGTPSSLSLAVGAALVEALTDALALEQPLGLQPDTPSLALKWPNDLWLRNQGVAKKLAGILIETTAAALPQAPRVVVVGVGVNLRDSSALRSDATEHGVETLETLARAAGVAAKDMDDATLFHALVLAIFEAMDRHAREGLGPWLSCWQKHDLLAGQRVHAKHPSPGTDGSLLEGWALGPRARDGAYLVRSDDGTIHAVQSGELSLRLTHA